MDVNDYQKQAHTTAQYINSIAVMMAPLYRVVHTAGEKDAIKALEQVRYYLMLSYLALGLTGEAGEIANKAKKVLRGDGSLEGMPDELGDVSWYWVELISLLGLDASEITQQNVDKLQDRRTRGVIKGSGDYR